MSHARSFESGEGTSKICRVAKLDAMGWQLQENFMYKMATELMEEMAIVYCKGKLLCTAHNLR